MKGESDGAQEVPLTDLKLGDVVATVRTAAYRAATVVKIDGDAVHLERPYIHTADFEYTGGVISYVGIDRYTLPLTDAWPVLRLAVGPPLR